MFIKNNFIIISIICLLIISNIKPKIKSDEYALLNIPSINLKEKIYEKNSKYNDLKYGLYYLPESDSIEENEANIIIASHSGNAKTSYFKNIDQLKVNDEIKFIKNKKTFLFKVINIYEDKKDGNVTINKYNTKTISLVTCKKNTNDLHLIISAVYVGKLEKNT